MTGWRKVYCPETRRYLGCLWEDDLVGYQAENRRAETRWFRDEDQALAWLAGQMSVIVAAA